MDRPEDIPGYQVPLHVALTQPVLLAGAPRTFAILNGTLAMVIGLGLHLWWLGFPLGLVLHSAAVLMSKRDPAWFDVFRRQVRQPTITIRPGWPFRVLVNKDLVLAPYPH